jgi:hypothetical protein
MYVKTTAKPLHIFIIKKQNKKTFLHSFPHNNTIFPKVEILQSTTMDLFTKVITFWNDKTLSFPSCQHHVEESLQQRSVQ